MSEQQPSGVLIVEARFYDKIADDLVRGAVGILEEQGINYERLEVPGVFEIPAAIRFAIRSMEVRSASHRYDGFLALGCVIRGETDHYDHICREASRALMDLSTNYSVALGFGVLTCEDRGQAEERADPARKNKGAEAAKAVVAMMNLKRELRLVPR